MTEQKLAPNTLPGAVRPVAGGPSSATPGSNSSPISAPNTVNLRAFHAFAHLSEEQERLLLATTRRTQVDTGGLSVAESEFSREAYIVAEGRVTLERQTPMGPLLLANLEPGAIFGEMSFLETKPRSVLATAAPDTCLLLLDRRAVEATIAANPLFEVSLYWAFWRSLSAKLRATNQLLLRFFEAAGAAPAPQPIRPAEEISVDLARRREILRSLGLSNMEVNFLASLAEPKRLAPNQGLIRSGDAATEMYVVVEGRIMVSQHIPGAGEEALTFLGPGELFGEMSLLDDTVRCADAGATDEGAVVLAIRNEVASKVLNPRKASSIRLLKSLCSILSNRVRDTNEKLVGWYLLAGGTIPGQGG